MTSIQIFVQIAGIRVSTYSHARNFNDTQRHMSERFRVSDQFFSYKRRALKRVAHGMHMAASSKHGWLLNTPIFANTRPASTFPRLRGLEYKINLNSNLYRFGSRDLPSPAKPFTSYDLDFEM